MGGAHSADSTVVSADPLSGLRECRQALEDPGNRGDHQNATGVVRRKKLEASPSFGHDQGRRGVVPRLEPPLEVPVDPAGCYRAEIDGCRTHAANIASDRHHAGNAAQIARVGGGAQPEQRT